MDLMEKFDMLLASSFPCFSVVGEVLAKTVMPKLEIIEGERVFEIRKCEH